MPSVEQDRIDTGPDLSRLVVKVADDRREREAAFRLVYSAYLRAGLIEPNPWQMRVTPYHLAPETTVFVASQDGQVLCTVTLVPDGEMGVPMESIFPGEIEALRSRGVTFGEVSCLADRRRDFSRTLPVFLRVNRWMAQYARFHGLDRLVIAVHPRHARFYKRFMGFKEMTTEERYYPAVKNNPAIACNLEFAEVDRNKPICWEQIFSTPIPPTELRRRPMSLADLEYFAAASEYSSAFIPIGG